MDFPLIDLMDELACYEELLALLHPGGLGSTPCVGRSRRSSRCSGRSTIAYRGVNSESE